MRLKILHRGPLEYHYLRTKYHEDLPSGSKVISGGQTDRQTGDVISLLSFSEIWLKEQILTVQDRDGKVMPQQKGLLRPEVKMTIIITLTKTLILLMECASILPTGVPFMHSVQRTHKSTGY
jgi:hypothetical protein